MTKTLVAAPAEDHPERKALLRRLDVLLRLVAGFRKI